MTRAVHLIQGTAHGQSAAIQHMRIDHRRFHIFMAQEFLHRPDIIALLEQMRRKGNHSVSGGRRSSLNRKNLINQ
jgi:hypothetical protein